MAFVVELSAAIFMDHKVSRTPIQGMVLDSLRGFAALAVLISHADQNRFVSLDILSVGEVKGFIGALGVGLFFILSGYLIWTSAKKILPQQGGLWVYVVHRATRLMPLYYVNLLAAAILIPALGSHFVPEVSFETIWRHLTFTQSLAPSVSRALNPVLWSLTHEMLFYAIVPILFVIMQRTRLEWLILVAMLSMFPTLQKYASVFSPFFQNFYLFVIGISAAERIKQPLSPWAALATVLGFAFGVQAGLLDTSNRIAMGVAVVMFLCAFAVRSLSGTLAGAALRPMALVGAVSYSLYIWHYLLLNVMSFHMQSIFSALEAVGLQLIWFNEFLRGIFTICIAVTVATISYWLFEKPSMGSLRRQLLKARGV
jgi:peptidoglycan/LPS O-acetylase OafA/YrhL